MSMKKPSIGTAIGGALGMVIILTLIAALFWSAATTDNSALALMCWILGPIECVVFLLHMVRAFLKSQVS